MLSDTEHRNDAISAGLWCAILLYISKEHKPPTAVIKAAIFPYLGSWLSQSLAGASPFLGWWYEEMSVGLSFWAG